MVYICSMPEFEYDPRKSEANSNLLAFQKTVCRGGAAQRYADECTQAQELLKIVGGQAP